ncbi:hypothetical protein [Undibacterium sp.]|uniref:hypothetical protein n=1 Tax=Undibacterium sp. TaxID=1914977 RepID=UPI0025EA7820|nr:hypothetical protein [Undibacterium sp.]
MHDQNKHRNDDAVRLERTMLSQEWLLLQSQSEQLERSCLLIKLVCVLLFALGLMLTLNWYLAAAFVCILWLQEAIVRTSQARLVARILQLEASLRDAALAQAETQVFQLHTQWQQQRGGALGLMLEYLKNAARPTVVFPYLALLMLDAMLLMLW